MLAADMYQENILDHYRNPRNRGIVENPTAQIRDSNPLCGDIIEISMKIENNAINDIKFKGSGCAISQASASMLMEEVAGKSVDEAKQIGKEQVLEMLGVEISPVRLKCAFLGLKVFKLCLHAANGEAREADL